MGLIFKVQPQHKRFWAEIDLDCASWNFKTIKSNLQQNTKLCCVIKANAYGHGAVQLAKLYSKLGADYFAVSNLEEGMQLRKNGIKEPILILGYTSPDCADILSEYSITQSVFSDEYAYQLEECARKANVSIKIHIKLDTGMGRIGFYAKDGLENASNLESVLNVCKLDHLIPEGIFTHFSSADEGEKGSSYTKMQYENFMKAIQNIEKNGIKFSIRHCANSAAIFDYPEYHLDMVRAGIVLFGAMPSCDMKNSADLKPVMSLKAVVSQVKTIDKGEYISYGRTFETPEKMKVATIPVGYADGFLRANSINGTKLLIKGKRGSILGRVCMDQLILDVSDVENVNAGDTVTVIGKQNEDEITVNELAKRNGTINYEILCSVGERVPRLYIENDKIVSVKDNIISD